MVYALSDTIWQTIDTKITVGVKNFLGVIDRNFLIKTLTKPEPSAIPIPNVATIVMPNGGNPIKFLTELITKVKRLSGVNMLMILIFS